jgi:Zn-dependent protease
VHPDREAISTCGQCQEPWCHDCLRSTDAGLLCVGCIAEIREATAGPATASELVGKVRPSPIFLVVLGAFVAACVWAWTVTPAGPYRWAVRAVVFSGWILSLCLHEFGHASTAFMGGDRTVASKGYLTLDPRRYANVGLSLGLPVLFLLLGGIGLPGGAVWINHGLIPKKSMRSLMSLAGPAANFVIAAVLGTLIRIGLFDSRPVLLVAMAFLVLLQISTGLLNLIPMPGLDGFGVLAPYLPESVLKAIAPIRQFGIFLLFLLLFQTGASTLLWETAATITRFLGVGARAAYTGQDAFRF